jgi:hypothetical protein
VVGTFKANIPYNNFLLFLYGFLLKLPIFLHPVIPVPRSSDGILYRAFLHWLEPTGKTFPHLYSLLALFLVYLQALSLNKLVNHQKLLSKPNYLSGMSYLLITSVFPGWYGLSATLIVGSFLIRILSWLSDLHNNPDAKTTIYNIGLMTGLATLFYFPSVVFILLVLIGLAITRTFKLPEWIIAFLGVSTPYYFLWSWMFLTGNSRMDLTPTFALSIPQFPKSPWEITGVVFILFTVVVGFIFTQNNMRRLLVQSRKSWNIIYICLLIGFIIPFLNAVPNFNYWMLTTVPMAALAASAFYFPDRKWFAFVMHWGLVLISAVMGIFYVMK